jgi:DNA-binding IclR family transcriptional regulator
VLRLLEAVRADSGRAGGATAADLARRANISPATCHAVMATLLEGGFVVRDPAARTYRLGPALIRLGDTARTQLGRMAGLGDADGADGTPADGALADGGLGRLRPMLVDLARRTRLPCTASATAGEEIVFLEHVGGGRPVYAGQRIPCAPPFGAIHLAWSGPAAAADWAARAPWLVSDDLHRRYRDVLAGIREHGYAVSPFDGAAVRLAEVIGELAEEVRGSEQRVRTRELLGMLQPHDYLPADLAGSRRLSVNTVSAPVFGPSGVPAVVASVHVQRPDVPAAEVRRLAGLLRAATAAMTAATGGTEPAPPDRP